MDRKIMTRNEYYVKHRILNKEQYEFVQRKLLRFLPDSVLDVGGGHYFLSPLSGYYCKRRVLLDVREKKQFGEELLDAASIEFIEVDVLKYHGDLFAKNEFDLLVCTEVLEHLEDPGAFVKKIFDFAKVKIFTVPYRWGPLPGHLHNGITIEKFISWFPVEPDEIYIFKKKIAGSKILGAIFKGGQ